MAPIFERVEGAGVIFYARSEFTRYVQTTVDDIVTFLSLAPFQSLLGFEVYDSRDWSVPVVFCHSIRDPYTVLCAAFRFIIVR